MNSDDVSRRLRDHGAVLRLIMLVPKEHDVPDERREAKLNLVEVDGGYLVCSYDRGQPVAPHRFERLDDACRYVAEQSRQLAEVKASRPDEKRR